MFKPYVLGQPHFLPPSYDDLIEAGHLVRVVNAAIDHLDLSSPLAQYKGGGTSSYRPQMLPKVLVHAYCTKIYSSRRIAAALRESIHFMWLSRESRPDFRTINKFRSNRMKDVIDKVSAETMEHPIEAGYVQVGTEGQFIVGFSVHNRAGDPGCLIPHLEQVRQNTWRALTLEGGGRCDLWE